MKITEDFEERKAMLAAIIDSSEDAIISKNLNGIIISWNRSAERMFGYSEEEIKGKHISILIPDERKHEEEIIISQLREGKRVEHFETIRITKSGRKLNISLTISPIKNSQGKIIGASKIARDITKQKQTEAELLQYARRLELINSATKNISKRFDVSGILQKVTDITTQLANASFGAFFYNKTDSTGNTYMLYALSGAPKEAFEKFGMPRNTDIFNPTFKGEGIVRSDDITKDPRYGKNTPHHGMPKGHLPVVSYLAVPVISQSGTVIGGLFFGHPMSGIFKQEHADLVEAIAMQAAIVLDNAKLYEEVQALSVKKDQFIAFASHELKTPLTALKGYVQLAKLTSTFSEDFLDRMSRQIERLAGIINDLLDISKIQAGKLDLNFIKTSLNTIVRESVEATTSNNHVIDIDIPSEDIIVNVDPQKIMQVIINLLTNAIKFSNPQTKIFLSVVRIGEEIKISIKDHGMGIPQQELHNIFNQFYQIKKSQNRKEDMGLGLFICKVIIEGHMGKIWAESEEGKGTVFHVTLPIERIKNK